MFVRTQKRPFQELSSKKYIQSVEKNFLKMFDDAPEALDDDELNKLAELTDEVTFLDEFESPEGKVTSSEGAILVISICQ